MIDTTDNTKTIYSVCCNNVMLLTVTNHCNVRLRNLSNAVLNIKEGQIRLQYITLKQADIVARRIRSMRALSAVYVRVEDKRVSEGTSWRNLSVLTSSPRLNAASCSQRIKINYRDMKVLLLWASMVAYSQDVSIIMSYLHVNLPITMLTDVGVGNPYDTTSVINPHSSNHKYVIINKVNVQH